MATQEEIWKELLERVPYLNTRDAFKDKAQAEKQILSIIERWPVSDLKELERWFKQLSGKVMVKLSVRKETDRLNKASMETRLSAVRGWIFKEFEKLEARAQSPAFKNRIRPKLRHAIGNLFTMGITVNRRNGEDIYYIANFRGMECTPFYHKDLENGYTSMNYCCMDKQDACDRMARIVLGFASNNGVSEEQLFRLINGSIKSQYDEMGNFRAFYADADFWRQMEEEYGDDLTDEDELEEE